MTNTSPLHLILIWLNHFWAMILVAEQNSRNGGLLPFYQQYKRENNKREEKWHFHQMSINDNSILQWNAISFMHQLTNIIIMMISGIDRIYCHIKRQFGSTFNPLESGRKHLPNMFLIFPTINLENPQKRIISMKWNHVFQSKHHIRILFLIL